MMKLILFSLNAFAKQESPTLYAEKLDALYNFLVVLSTIACVGIVILFMYFAIKFRRKSDSEVGKATVFHNVPLEVTWSAIPFLIFVVAFVWGLVVYKDYTSAPENRMEVHVYGQKWSWDFVYKNGRKITNEFYVPVNTPVKLIMTSRDVIHSFFIPSFRIKQDVVPGMYTTIWFEAKKKGSYQVFCTEFCGTGHSQMLAKVHVVSQEKWEDWLSHDPYKNMTLSQIGKTIFESRCTICHKATEEKLIGPGMAGLFGKNREFEKGGSVIADENYIRESILNPAAKITKGYPNQMTPFAGALTEEELSGLVEYIKSLK